MRLSTWAATLSITTSTVILVGTWAIVGATEPPPLRTIPTIPTPSRPVETGPRYNAVQVFEGGTAWKDTQRLALAGTRSPEPALVIAGIKPGHHLRTLVSGPRRKTVEIIIAAAGVCAVPAGIALRLAARESSFRQWDHLGRPLRSSAGAVGLMQIKPSTARDLSPTLDIWNSEWENAVSGLCHLSSLRGTWREKVLAYRVGASGVRTAAAHSYADAVLAGGAQ